MLDPLAFIFSAMAAILFGWIGYALGNFFPVGAKAKKAKEQRVRLREVEGRDPVRETLDWFKNAGKKIIYWLLEREDELEEEEAVEIPPTDSLAAQYEEAEALAEPELEADSEPQPQVPTPAEEAAAPSYPQTAPMKVLIDTPAQAGDDAVVLWHNKRTKKLFAKLENEIIDLDSDLSPSDHGTLAMLLVDLQERVGIAATLRDALADGADKVMTKKERQPYITPDEEKPLEKPSFNPIKSLVNYVRSDIPKIDQSISIPDQIDEILQANLAGTEFENRGISVREWPGRGVVFIVGIDVYDDLHKVPDPEIRDHIRRAVKQWEASQEEEDK